MKLMMSPKIPETKTEPVVKIDEHPVNYDADCDTSSTTRAGNSNEGDDEYDADFPAITNDHKKSKSVQKNG